MSVKTISVFTKTPRRLRRAILEEIDKGNIKTWAYDAKDTRRFTHVPDQWNQQAWLLSEDLTGILLFELRISKKAEYEDQTLYGIYFGRFIEMLVVHFSSYINEVLLD